MIATIDRIERVLVALGSISGVATVVMILAVVPDIIARNFYNVALHGVGELCVALLVIMVFFGLAGAQVQGAHFKVSMLETIWGQNRIIRTLKYFGIILSIGVFTLITWLTGVNAWRSFVQGEMELGVATFPVWPQRMVVTVGLALLTLQLTLDLLRLIAGAERATDPIAEGH